MALISCKAVLLLAWLAPACGLAQTAQASPTETQLNVLARDHDGHPIHKLTASDFHLTANGQPVPITRAAEHTAATPVQPIKPFPLPPGTFTNLTPIAPSATLNIVVFDALNTPVAAQASLRQQLRQFAEHAPSSGHYAVFGLTTHLILLQDFTTDPTVLKDAVEHKLIPRGQALLDTTHDLTRTAAAQHDLQLMQTAANLHLFEASLRSADLQFRPQYTLDALHTLAAYLAALPGHKNVLWLAPSFPVTLAPTSTSNDELRQTAALFNAASVSLYPIDTRSFLASPNAKAHPIQYPDSAAAERSAMQQLASPTGGVAVTDASNLLDAVTRVSQIGTAYYTLTFSTPTASQSLQLTLSNPAETLIYPHADITASPSQDNAVSAALARGAPAPEAIPFKVRVLPAATAPEPTIAPGNQQDPSYKVPGPWQRYVVDFAALPSSFPLAAEPNDLHSGKFEALAYVYDIDGRVLNTLGKTITLHLTPTEYDRFRRSALELQLEISVPVRQQCYLRVALHDLTSGRIGVVALPISAVSHLAPAPSNPNR